MNARRSKMERLARKPAPTNGAAALAADAPLTPEEAALYGSLVQLGGGEVANVVAEALARTGLPVGPGCVSVDWNGSLMWRPPMAVARRVSPRIFFAALGGGSAHDKQAALMVLRAEAAGLAQGAPGTIRAYAEDVKRAVDRALNSPPVDDVSGRGGAGAVPEAPPEPSRIILARG